MCVVVTDLGGDQIEEEDGDGKEEIEENDDNIVAGINSIKETFESFSKEVNPIRR